MVKNPFKNLSEEGQSLKSILWFIFLFILVFSSLEVYLIDFFRMISLKPRQHDLYDQISKIDVHHTFFSKNYEYVERYYKNQCRNQTAHLPIEPGSSNPVDSCLLNKMNQMLCTEKIRGSIDSVSCGCYYDWSSQKLATANSTINFRNSTYIKNTDYYQHMQISVNNLIYVLIYFLFCLGYFPLIIVIYFSFELLKHLKIHNTQTDYDNLKSDSQINTHRSSINYKINYPNNNQNIRKLAQEILVKYHITSLLSVYIFCFVPNAIVSTVMFILDQRALAENYQFLSDLEWFTIFLYYLTTIIDPIIYCMSRDTEISLSTKLGRLALIFLPKNIKFFSHILKHKILSLDDRDESQVPRVDFNKLGKKNKTQSTSERDATGKPMNSKMTNLTSFKNSQVSSMATKMTNLNSSLAPSTFAHDTSNSLSIAMSPSFVEDNSSDTLHMSTSFFGSTNKSLSAKSGRYRSRTRSKSGGDCSVYKLQVSDENSSDMNRGVSIDNSEEMSEIPEEDSSAFLDDTIAPRQAIMPKHLQHYKYRKELSTIDSNATKNSTSDSRVTSKTPTVTTEYEHKRTSTLKRMTRSLKRRLMKFSQSSDDHLDSTPTDPTLVSNKNSTLRTPH